MINFRLNPINNGTIDMTIDSNELELVFAEQEFIVLAEPKNKKIKDFKILGSDFVVSFNDSTMRLKTMDNLSVKSSISYEKIKNMLGALFKETDDGDIAAAKKKKQVGASPKRYWVQKIPYRAAANDPVFRFDYSAELDLDITILNVRTLPGSSVHDFELDPVDIRFVLGRLERYQPL